LRQLHDVVEACRLPRDFAAQPVEHEQATAP
jgi:hypothetical protein